MLRNFTCILSIVLYSAGYGQRPNNLLFENINPGTEASVINCFLQDSLGLIWMGTDKGLFSYDGYSAQPHFTFGERNNTRVYCGITIGDLLYLGTDNGLLVYHCRTDSYEEPGINSPPDVRALTLRNGTLWIGTLNGLYTFDLQSKALNKIDRKKYKGLTHETIYAILRSQDDRIYIGTYNGLCRYLPESDCFESVSLPGDSHKSNQFVNSLLEDRVRHCIWIGTEGNLFQYLPAVNEVKQIETFHKNSVKSLALDSRKNLLAGTDNGLYIYHESQPLQHIIHDSRNSTSLSNNIVWSIFADKEKNIWLGTDYGVSLLRFNNEFRYIPISQITSTGDGNHFYALFKDSRGKYWFGGTNGIIRSEGVSGNGQAVWYKMGDKQNPLAHNRVRDIYEDREHLLWIATDGSISRYDDNTRQFIRYTIVDRTGKYNCNWAYNLYEDEYGKLWIGTYLGGIFAVDKKKLLQCRSDNYVAEYNYNTENGLSGMSVSQLVPDHDGNLWVLLYNNGGINKINTRTREITRVSIGNLSGKEYLNYLICDSSGTVWAGFSNGIMRFTSGKEKPEVASLGKFGYKEVLSMIEVGKDIWVSTTDGVWTVDKKTMKTRQLNVMDKVFTSLFYSREENKVYMGSVDGIVVTSPEIVRRDFLHRPIAVTAFYVNNQFFSGGNRTNGESIRYLHALDLNHTENNLSFEVSDFPYALEEKNQFVYKLTNIDRDWNIVPPNTNRITYNNLTYGRYRLMISKLDADGNPLENSYTLDIRIRPPWYYTPLAKSVYLLLVISLMAWVINFFRVKNRLKFERLEKERIMEQSRSKMDFFTGISHDLKTPLSMIIAPVSKLLLEVKEQPERKQLESIQRNAMKLNSLIHQVLDFNRIDSNTSSFLILSKVEFIAFSRNLFSAFGEGVAREKEMAFSFESDLPEIYMDIDVIKFESILNNLFSNAFKYTPEKGKITLSVRGKEDPDRIKITVSDTGQGIPQQDVPYIFQRFFQSSGTAGKKEGTGVGLYLVKAYSELHGGSVQVTSQEQSGTSFIIYLPLHSEEVPAPEEIHPVKATEVSEEKPEELTEAPEGNPLILIVEDNLEIAGFLYDILHIRYRCQLAENGKTGMEYCFKLLPDLIIADIMMPVMNGLEMCRQIKKNIPTSTIPIILLTAQNDKETELESIHLNIDTFIAKPFEPDILLSRVEQLLASKQQMEAKTRMEVIATPKAIEAISLDEKFLSATTRIIEDRVDDPNLNVNALCELSGVNSKQLYRKIKQLTGLTPVEYIKSIRMKKAAMLLNQKKFTVAEVMYMVGFSNPSYFSKCFQAEFGKTPRQFMENNIALPSGVK